MERLRNRECNVFLEGFVEQQQEFFKAYGIVED